MYVVFVNLGMKSRTSIFEWVGVFYLRDIKDTNHMNMNQ